MIRLGKFTIIGKSEKCKLESEVYPLIIISFVSKSFSFFFFFFWCQFSYFLSSSRSKDLPLGLKGKSTLWRLS